MIFFDKSIHEYSTITDGKYIRLPSVTQLLEAVGLIKGMEYVDPLYSERGTEVHAMTELMDQGCFIPEYCSDSALPFVLQYEKFLQEHEVEYVKTEELVYNDSLFYAGILDRLWYIDGKLHLTDIKTGKKARTNVLQLVLYWMCLEEKNVALSNLYLTEDGYKLHTWKERPVAFCEAICQIYWFTRPRDYKILGGKDVLDYASCE